MLFIRIFIFFIEYLIKQLISRWFPHHAPLWCFSLSHLISVLEFILFPSYFFPICWNMRTKEIFSILIIYQLIQFHTSIIELYCAYVPRQQNGKRERYKFMYGNIYVWRVIKTRESAIHYFFFNKKKVLKDWQS